MIGVTVGARDEEDHSSPSPRAEKEVIRFRCSQPLVTVSKRSSPTWHLDVHCTMLKTGRRGERCTAIRRDTEADQQTRRGALAQETHVYLSTDQVLPPN